MVVEQFSDRLVQILLAVAIFSAVTSYFENNARAFVEPTVIILILVLNAAVGVWQSRSAEGAVSALRLLQPSVAAALRDGEWLSEMPAKDLVPGDVVLLRVGDKVPADARLLQFLSSMFSVDEGSLTGESATVAKSLDSVSADVPIQGKTNMVFSGTMITAGSAYAIVTATGMNTEIGKIQAGVQAAKAEEEKTPLGQKLDAFGAQLSSIIGFVCLAVWFINFPRFFDPIFKNPFEGGLYYLKIAVALGVAAIPEGLPAVITLCLSLGTRRMADRNVIVRKLPSVETLGCTTVICSDKTGTLTTNQMTVTTLVHVVSAGTEEGRMAKAAARDIDGGDQEKGKVVAVQSMRSQSNARKDTDAEPVAEPSQGPMLVEHAVGGLGYSPQGTAMGLSGKLAASACMVDMIETAVLCNDASLFFKDGQFQRTGEPTEAAIKVLAEKLGKAVPEHRYGACSSEVTAPEDACRQTAQAVASKWERIATLDFNRDRKSMSVVVRPRDKKVSLCTNNCSTHLSICKAPNFCCSCLVIEGQRESFAGKGGSRFAPPALYKDKNAKWSYGASN
jgi:Ca2+-transporting ATPase